MQLLRMIILSGCTIEHWMQRQRYTVRGLFKGTPGIMSPAKSYSLDSVYFKGFGLEPELRETRKNSQTVRLVQARFGLRDLGF